MNTQNNEADLLTKQLSSGYKRKCFFETFCTMFSGAMQQRPDYYASNSLRPDMNNYCESECKMILPPSILFIYFMLMVEHDVTYCQGWV